MAFSTRSLTIFGAVVALLVSAGPAAAAPSKKPSARVHAASPGKKRVAASASLLSNGSFEGTISPWSAYQAAVAVTPSGVAGSSSMRVSAAQAGGSTYAASAVVTGKTSAGASYAARGSFRGLPGRQVCLRVREWSGKALAGSSSVCRTATGAWQHFPALTYKAAAAGSSLDLMTYSTAVARGDGFLVDALTVVDVTPVPAAPTPTSPAPRTPSPTPTTSTPAPAPAPSTGPRCDRYAATTGDDGAAGTASAPFRTVARLAASLTPGTTGCLLPGTYEESVSIHTGGSAGAPITITSAGERAVLRGRLWVAADDVVVANLLLDGRNATSIPSPLLTGTRDTLKNNEITNYDTAICLTIGSSDGWGTARDAVIDGNRIHNCGRRPATNQAHGIYLDSSRNAHIVNNVIYDNADRGIQLFPDAQGTLIDHNVIDGNGEGVLFGGWKGMSTSNNVVRANVISNSSIRTNVEAWWDTGTAPGSGNVVEGNCIWGGAKGNVDSEEGGFSSGSNIQADPGFVARGSKDFRLAPGSPCAAMAPAS